MKKLDISITKATLKSFTVSIGEDKIPNVSATIALLTEGGKEITDYTIRTNAWDDKTKMELPVSVLAPLGEAAKILEGVAVRHCRDGQKSLATSTAPALDDSPIDLSEIPF